MFYLTTEQVLFVHYRLIQETGGDHGTFNEKELYLDVFEKAAALMQSLVNNHPFIDGNKRTGIACAVLFFKQNGVLIHVHNRELEEFTLKVAKSEIDTRKITKWFNDAAARS